MTLHISRYFYRDFLQLHFVFFLLFKAKCSTVQGRNLIKSILNKNMAY